MKRNSLTKNETRLYQELIQALPELAKDRIISLLNSLDEVDQTSPYHEEGDVLTHTCMVVEELDKILDEKEGGADYSKPLHKTLLVAAWFHDIGKLETAVYKPEKGRNTFYNHEEASARMWRELYIEYGIEPLFGEHVFELLKNHRVPIVYSKQNAHSQTYKRLAERVCPYHLYLLSSADMRGRIAKDVNASLELLEKFRKRAEENKVFENDRFRGYRFYSLADFSYIARNKRCLLLPIAVPGTGKSYLREQMMQFNPDMHIVCPDDIRTELYGSDWHNNYAQVDNQKVFGLATHRLKLKMQQSGRQLIYFDAQNSSIKDRKNKVEMTTKYNFATICFWFNVRLATVLKRNSQRDRQVPEEYIKRAFGHLQLPTQHETEYTVVVQE